MDSRRRAELLASLSPEGRATYEILRAQLARDLDWSFAESNSRLQKAMAATAPTTPAASEASTTNWAATAVLAATTANPSTPGSVQTATAADISTPATASAPSAHTATSTCIPIVAVLDSTPPRVQAVTATAPTAAARVDLNLKRGIDHLVGSSAAPASNPSDVITPATAASAAIATSPRSTSSTASWTAASVGVATASASSTMSPAAEALLTRTMGSQNPASSIPVPVVTVSASHDSDLALATPTMCSTECPGEENSATRVTPTHIGALLASPTSAQKMNTSSLWHAIAVSEFSSSQVHHLLRCELPKFVTALVCLPLLPWDGKYMWLPPDPLYGLKSKSRLLEHDMRDCFLFVKRDNSHIIHVHASIDEDALFIIGNRRAQQFLCQWRVSQPQGRLQEGNIGRAEAIVSSGMFLSRRNFQLALLYAVVLYCSGASDSLPVAIALDRSEQFSWIIAWLPRAFPDCSRIIAEKFCNVMAVPVFRLGISVQSLSCFAAARYAPIQWEIAWLIGPLQDNISSCFKTYSSSCGFEFQQWRIAWSFSDALLQHELLSCTCGAVSFFVSEQVQWKIACSLCYDFSVLDTISMRFLCECSAAMNWCKNFQNHVEFSDDRSLKVMVQCSFLELVSCTLSQAHASVFYHGRFVQLGFEFSCLMVWEIDWVRCSMYIVDASSFPCSFFRKEKWCDIMRCNKAVSLTYVVVSGYVVKCCRMLISVIALIPIADQCSNDMSSWNYPVSSSNTGILTSTRVKELHKGYLVAHPSGMLLAKVIATMHIIHSRFPLPAKIYGFSMIIRVQAQYSYACTVTGNIHLQSIGECSAIEMVSYQFLNASASHWMGCKIVWVLCTVSTDEAYDFQCPVFTKLTLGSKLGQPNALLSTVIPDELTFQALQMTWDPGEMLRNWFQFVVQTPWDPGGLTWNRLEGKPKVMEGGLSASSPILSHGLDLSYYMGRITSCSWAWTEAGDHYTYREMTRGATRLGLDGGYGR